MSRLLDDFMRVANGLESTQANMESELETKATKDDVQVLKTTLCSVLNTLDTLVERIAGLKGRIDKMEWVQRGDDGK